MLKTVKEVLKEGQGYFSYLYNLKEENKYDTDFILDFNEIALDEEKYLQLWWKEGINQSLIAWLFDIPMQKVTATHTQKLIIDVKSLDYRERNIFLELNRNLFLDLSICMSLTSIDKIKKKDGGSKLFTYLKWIKEMYGKYELAFLNREMFYQLWWKEGISDKEIGEFVGMSERRVREIRTKEWLVTAPYLIDAEKGIDNDKN